MTTERSLALFDFDGTLFVGDSLYDFLVFAFGFNKVFSGAVLLSPFLAAYKFNLCSPVLAKEKVFAHFFKNRSVSSLDLIAEKYFRLRGVYKLRKNGVAKIHEHLAHGHTVAIVSASAFWVRPFAEYFGLIFISTALEVEDGRYTGRMSGRNCNGLEKVNRVKEVFDLSAYCEIYAYGDTSGDAEMLALATKKFYRTFI
jgi:HAD superfamily hydrolase (TIGR01490 family)